ncbi:MAG: hypothetical protein DRJ61_07550 [Acidobacteria bacterium]|nr:MAG: hypothetical protein DRJ65_15510 [Acidobacteriota bacterium]RLE33295.1 MAG: hypothetical protein DRJ61_07550 [Acidobacteriota bacterium]
MAVVLVVDDDAMTLKLLEHTLVSGGHEVVATANSQEAAFLAASHQVDAVILDVIMPGRSGFDVLKDLHLNSETKKLPVLMLSSLGEAEDRVKGLRGGADEYIGKPFNPEELLLRLNRLIDGRVADWPEFQGCLETLAFAEVIQSLEHGATSGVLEVGSGDRRGTVTVTHGVPMKATWGRLEGFDAVLAMMDMNAGTFQFHEQTPPDSSKAADGQIDIQKVLFTGAWLADELTRWPEVGDHVPLSVRQGIEDPVLPSEWNLVPVETVFEDIRSNSGISIVGLQAMERWAPQRIVLAIRFMMHSGDIEVAAKGMRGEDTDGMKEETLLSAVDAVIKTIEQHGFSCELPHVLILVEPLVYGAFLEARQALSAEDLVVSGESITAAWQGGRVATLAFRGLRTGLVLHVVSMESPAGLKQVRAQMTDYPAVVVWLGDPKRVDELEWVFESIETAQASQWGILSTIGQEAAAKAEQVLKGKKRWRLNIHNMTKMEDLLRVIAEG